MTDSNETLQSRFEECANNIKQTDKTIPDNDLLELYSYYKQATCGDCDTKKPSQLNFKAYKKWDAWDSLIGMEKDEAMELYIELADQYLS